ncbi:MAG: response regulator [Comamonadaceae bacterium]|nr:MAG: response regulator [Comamonadaceae bacterium]
MPSPLTALAPDTAAPDIDADATQPASFDSTSPAARTTRVLLIDPDRNARLYLRAKLASAQFFEVDEAATGAEALGLVKQCSYRLAVLDLEQADTGSWKLLRQLRESGKVSQILMTGTRFSPLDRVRAWFADVSATLVKPLHPAKFMRELEKIRRRK